MSFSLANKSQEIYLTPGCLGINPDGPGRFRTQAGSAEDQICYFNNKNNDKFFNTFLSKKNINSDLKETNTHF